MDKKNIAKAILIAEKFANNEVKRHAFCNYANYGSAWNCMYHAKMQELVGHLRIKFNPIKSNGNLDKS